MPFLEKLQKLKNDKKLPKKTVMVLEDFYHTYKKAVEENRGSITPYLPLLEDFLDFAAEQIESPFAFEPYHKKITHPYDYYRFGKDFMRPLILMRDSKVLGKENLDKIVNAVKKKENVILFANHQTEPDPQAISLLLEQTHEKLAQEMIFVAGHRVITDPLTVPFSKGCNLICIFSKHYVEHPPEEKEYKLHHNQKAMRRLKELLDEGGHCIYVAPSGGRDRPDETGKVEVREFDPQSIELFRLIGKQTKKPTHFYPLALYTYDLLPPPNSVKNELGETRQTKLTPIHLNFGKEIDTEKILQSSAQDKKERRQALCDHVYKLVKELYDAIRTS